MSFKKIIRLKNRRIRDLQDKLTIETDRRISEIERRITVRNQAIEFLQSAAKRKLNEQ